MVEEQPSNRKTADQLSLMNKLLSVLVSLNMEDAGMTMTDEVRIMARAGLTPSEIATILGTSPNNISVVLYKLRKGPPKHAKKDLSQEQ